MYKFYVVMLALALSACGNNAMVAPLAMNQFEITAVGSSRQGAMAEALDKAPEVCQRYYVVAQNISYQGMFNENTQKSLDAVARAVPLVDAATSGGSSVQYYTNPLKSGSDYEARIVIQCN